MGLIELVVGVIASVIAKELVSVVRAVAEAQRNVSRELLRAFRDVQTMVAESLRLTSRMLAGVLAVPVFVVGDVLLPAAEWLASGVWVSAIRARHLMATIFTVGGVLSLWISRQELWWVDDSWWVSLHMNVGIVMVGIGLIDSLLMPVVEVPDENTVTGPNEDGQVASR